MGRFRRHLFGYSKAPSPDAHIRYSLPPGIKLIECVEDVNGEWVAPVSGLAKKVVDKD